MPYYCPDKGTCHLQEKRRAAGAISSTVGIEPTPSGTKPPCTSIKLCYRCGLKTRVLSQTGLSRRGLLTHSTRNNLSASRGSSCTVWALRGHCMHTAHADAGILTQVIRLVVTVLFPRNPFQKNEQSKNIWLFMEVLFLYRKPRAQDQCFTTKR